MYNSIESFIKDFKHEQNSTIKYFNSINDEKLEVVFHENIRTIGWLSWHIVVTVSEMLKHAGLNVSGPADENVQPNNMADMIEQYNTSCESAINEISTHWNDAQLNDDVAMYGQTWKKGVVLSALLFHQAHHRGQLSILMRLSEVKVPGIIGPAKEEWGAWGMPTAK
jgi:uncharacterized damage-inducible protein DinB